MDNKQISQSPFIVSIGIDPFFIGVYLSCGPKTVLLKSGALQKDIANTVLDTLKQAGRVIGFPDLHDLLVCLPIIRLCTSIVQTDLLLRQGQLVGLLVSAELVNTARRILRALGLPGDMVIDIPAPHTPQAVDTIKLAFNRLLNLGARCIGVCLTESWRNPMDEQKIHMIINRQYPAYYLGSVPLLRSADYEICLSDEERLVTLVIDCYMRQTWQTHCNVVKTALARQGFKGVFLIAEGSKGLSPVPRVRPSTVALAAHAALFTVAKYWIEKVHTQGIALNIGSLCSEVAIIGGREYPNPHFSSLLPENTLGGIASTLKRRSGRFVLTPPDNLAAPGRNYPNRKKQEPTLLDALIVLGLISPSSLGRARLLSDRSTAYSAMGHLVGQGAEEIEAAAFRAFYDVVDDLTRHILRQIKQRGLDTTSAFLVCGEVGGIFACAIAERLGWKVLYTIPGSSLTLAMGAVMMELKQQFRYRLEEDISIQEPAILQHMMSRLKQQSERILHGAFLDHISVFHQYALECVARTKDNNVTQHIYHKINEMQPVSTDMSLVGLLDTGVYKPVAINLQLTGYLKKDLADFNNIKTQLYGINQNREKMRKLYSGPKLGWQAYPLHQLSDLGEGEVLTGPVIIEAAESVYWVPSGWHYIIGNNGMDRIEQGEQCESKDN